MTEGIITYGLDEDICRVVKYITRGMKGVLNGEESGN